MTTKELAIRAIEELPADTTLEQIVGTLQDMLMEGNCEQPEEADADIPKGGGLWDFLERTAGTVEMPADWSSEHDHYLYGTPKRSSVNDLPLTRRATLPGHLLCPGSPQPTGFTSSAGCVARERVKQSPEVVITEAVLAEVGNALSRTPDLRRHAAEFIRGCYGEPNMCVVAVDTTLLTRALDLFERRSDKEWGLTDCISFVVMRDRGLHDAATEDRHFQQAGFRALMADAEP
jgi:hypothetical protein